MRMPAGYTQILFARPPLPGRVKTRLASFLGDERAAALYRKLLERSLGAFGEELRASAGPGARLAVYSADAGGLDLLGELCTEAGLPPGSLHLQAEDSDLGARMAAALYECAERALAAGLGPEHPVLLTGTDIPEYRPAVARRAARVLQEAEVALGPTRDGGYYLIGMRAGLAKDLHLLQRIFAGMHWSQADVFARQTEALRRAGLRTGGEGELPVLRDLDTINDFAEYLGAREGGASEAARELRSFFPDIRVILPVLNEAENLEYTLGPIRTSGFFREIICADNGSADGSPEIAERLGARVTHCAERGYGVTCLTALADLRKRGGCEIVCFMDADGADDPTLLPDLLAPLARNECDFALIARDASLSEPGALHAHARFGNWLITRLMKLFWKQDFRDLGPFRALRWEALEALQMDDRNYGWTVQMQIRAVRQGLRIREIPAPYRKRHAGRSKVTASLRGSYLAGKIIFRTLFRELFRRSAASFHEAPPSGETRSFGGT